MSEKVRQGKRSKELQAAEDKREPPWSMDSVNIRMLKKTKSKGLRSIQNSIQNSISMSCHILAVTIKSNIKTGGKDNS
jgi:hypothetical protein